MPLLNRPFLAYQLTLLRDHGVTDVILACSYRVDDVRQALGDGAAYGVRLRYVVEREPLGTGGGIRNAVDLARGTVVVLNGDVLTDADLDAMRRLHLERGSLTTLYLQAVDDPPPYGLVETAGDGRVRAFREKPKTAEEITTNTINAGIYIIDAELLLQRIPAHTVVSIEREFFPVLIADGVPTFGWVSRAYWRDIGSPAAYHAAQMDLLAGKVKTSLTSDAIAKDAQVSAKADVSPRTIVGARCRIAARARLDGAVLWENVTVGAAAVLQDCVVGSDATIGAGAEITAGTVIAPGEQVPDGARR